MIKAVIFDMDGLMIDTEKLLQKYWLVAAHTYGYAMEKQHVLGIRSLAAKYAAPKLQAELGADFDYEKVRSLRIKLMNEHIDAYGVEEKPGLGELLAYLKQNAYLTAVATATDWERTKRYLGSIGRLSYFDEIVCAPMVANGKPAPDIYLEAARRLNVEPSQCMALEDSPNGILAAYRAGMYPVMVPDLSEPDEDTKKLLYRCVGDLSQVIDLLKNI
ncbi:MAG: HAD family phosphatase [Eubacterium sp.]|jgi:HAD superfamily hydrolase (TIGR01509 family)|nr:HAD family phosphatase [Eubacterium sp.]